MQGNVSTMYRDTGMLIVLTKISASEVPRGPLVYIKGKTIRSLAITALTLLCSAVYVALLIKNKLSGKRFWNWMLLLSGLLILLINLWHVPTDWNYMSAINNILTAQG